MAQKNECLKYEKYFAVLNFEADHVSCQYCPLLETYARNQCRRTGEYILDTRSRGFYCPLIKIDEEVEKPFE